jgi:hypothetical protein
MSLLEKWSPWEGLEDRPYLQVPHRIFALLASKGFSSSSILVVLGMVSKIRQETGTVVSISHKTLGDYTGVATKTVARALLEMKEMGMRRITKGKKNHEAAIYDLAGFFAFLKRGLVSFDKKVEDG